ncbi:MAG: ATP synthase F1 subunit delta [Candidatus Eisenbacteria bacterium]|nr:ATP synthase F1 subunit delta [Candidatus Eisenbacteria bacterium]
MIDEGVGKRYAQALFGAAEKAGELDAVQSDLDSLEALLEKDESLIRFLESPRELDEEKVHLVEMLFRGRTTGLFVRLLLLLLEKKRILHLRDIARQYRHLLEEHRGIAEAIVTTAVPLPKDLEPRLVQELERIFERKIRIRPRIHPRIIGGVVVMVEGKVIDRSVRHDIDRMREELLATPVV